MKKIYSIKITLEMRGCKDLETALDRARKKHKDNKNYRYKSFEYLGVHNG